MGNMTTMDLGPSHSADPLWLRNHQETSQWKMFLDSLSADHLFVYSISMLLGLLAGAIFTIIVVDKCILKTNYFCNCLNRRDRVQTRVATAPLVAWQTVYRSISRYEVTRRSFDAVQFSAELTRGLLIRQVLSVFVGDFFVVLTFVLETKLCNYAV